MRTISVRLSLVEHRLLNDLAGAQGVSIETLVREALALAPFDARDHPARRLQIVRSDEARTAIKEGEDPSAPVR